MSEKQKKKSSEESDQQEKNSVYDFLYHDIHRIGSFLSQFDKNGLLTSHTHTLKTSIAEQSVYATDIKGGIEPIVSSRLSETESTNSSRAKDFARTYDPLWNNSLALLNYLHQSDLINRNILNSHIGQFILVSGNLFMLDMSFIQSLLTKTGLKQTLINNQQGGDELKSSTQIGMEIFCILPASIQAYLVGDNFSVWSTLRSEGLSLSTDDLHLKHGPSIAGKWNILGILDALPANQETIDTSSYPPLPLQFNDFFTIARTQFGRPPDYFGITPLLVFREATGN